MRKLFATGLIILILLSGCSAAEEPEIELLTPAMGTVDMAMVMRADINDMEMCDAEVIPDIREMSFDYDGYLSEVMVTYGEEVSKGDVLAIITGENQKSITDLLAEIKEFEEQGEAHINVLETELEFLEFSGEDTELKKLLIKHERELTELELKQKRERLDKLKADDIGSVQMTAPYDSTVIGLSGSASNGFISAGTPVIALIGDGKAMITCPYIKEKTIDECCRCYAIIHGKEYDVEYIPYNKEELNALVAQKAEMVSRFRFKTDDMTGIQPGDYATIIVVNDFRDKVITVPLNAIHTDITGKYVYEIINGEKVRRDITVGISDTSNAEVLSGIEEGAYVYVKN